MIFADGCALFLPGKSPKGRIYVFIMASGLRSVEFRAPRGGSALRKIRPARGSHTCIYGAAAAVSPRVGVFCLVPGRKPKYLITKHDTMRRHRITWFFRGGKLGGEMYCWVNCNGNVTKTYSRDLFKIYNF